MFPSSTFPAETALHPPLECEDDKGDEAKGMSPTFLGPSPGLKIEKGSLSVLSE